MTASTERMTAQEGPAVMALPAEIDLATGPAAAAGLLIAISAAPGIAVADMTATTFIDCVGARTLYRVHRAAAARGTELRFAITCPHVLKVLSLIGFANALPIYPSVAAALSPQ